MLVELGMEQIADKDDKNYVDDKVVFMNVLWKYSDVLHNYALLLFTTEWIDCFLVLQIS